MTLLLTALPVVLYERAGCFGLARPYALFGRAGLSPLHLREPGRPTTTQPHICAMAGRRGSSQQLGGLDEAVAQGQLGLGAVRLYCPRWSRNADRRGGVPDCKPSHPDAPCWRGFFSRRGCAGADTNALNYRVADREVGWPGWRPTRVLASSGSSGSQASFRHETSRPCQPRALEVPPTMLARAYEMIE
jgi:hypothetical protein